MFSIEEAENIVIMQRIFGISTWGHSLTESKKGRFRIPSEFFWIINTPVSAVCGKLGVLIDHI